MQYLIHESLKCLGGVSESKWHFEKLEKSKWSGHCRLRNVLRSQWDLVVGPDKVQLREYGSAL